MTENSIGEYEYICSSSDKTCTECKLNDKKRFLLDDIIGGTNYPPMHNNCSCTIEPAFDKENIMHNVSSVMEELRKLITPILVDKLDNNPIISALLTVGESGLETWWKIYKPLLNEYMNHYNFIEIDGNEYQVNRERFNGITILPTGEVISNKKESEIKVELKLLDLMKKRDEGIGDIEGIYKEIEELSSKYKGRLLVDYKKPYEYYILDEDVSERLHGFTRELEESYGHKADEFILDRLFFFKEKVKTRGEVDLKNKPEWQKSAYILNGEVVSQDVIGNYNYGYFGKVLGLPDQMLVAGAGIYQIYSGTSSIEYFWSIGDDPRDSFYALNGIDYYNKTH